MGRHPALPGGRERGHTWEEPVLWSAWEGGARRGRRASDWLVRVISARAVHVGLCARKAWDTPLGPRSSWEAPTDVVPTGAEVGAAPALVVLTRIRGRTGKKPSGRFEERGTGPAGPMLFLF